MVTLAAVQAFGVGSHPELGSGSADSLTVTDSVVTAKDTLTAKDSLTARDTIKAPDSLKITDPFFSKYYLAVKDSLTRVQVRDSLIAAKDTVELMKLDSLYVKDSTEVATAKFNAWYASLSKKERKKYDYEQALPAKMAEMRAKMERKDSLKAYKDSIVAATPRILETYAIPDSMQYKRLILWHHDRYFNDVDLQKFDTTYNYHFNDYPFLKDDVNATYLGVVGSAVQQYDYFKRTEEENAYFYTPYMPYAYNPETLPMYNTKTPYTELAYWGTLFAKDEKEESNIKILTTQNILPELNLTLEYHRFGSNGMLQNEKVDNRTAVVSTNYMGKRYLMHAGFIYNKVTRNENGGISDNFWIRDTLVDAKEIAVNLSDASNLIKKKTVFLDQSYRIPFDFIGKGKERKARKAEQARRDSIMAGGDSSAIAELQAVIQEELALEKENAAKGDSLDRNITSAFIGHSSEYSVHTKRYKDRISNDRDRAFYDNYYINPAISNDSLRVMKFENRVYLRLQPWKADGIVSKLDVGIGDKLLNYYSYNNYSAILQKQNTVLNSAYVYAGAQGQYKKYFNWDATGRYTFLGHEVNDFGIDANLTFKAYPFRRHKKSPLILHGHFETNLQEPDFYRQHIFTNHFRWDNDFKKVSTTKVETKLDIPRWDFKAGFAYALLSNNIYYDNKAIARQNSTPMSVMTVELMKNFKLWKFHLDNRALVQLSSNQSVVPLPVLSLNLRYYVQFDVVKKVMQMQIGADGRYNTLWYAPAYNPALGVFHSQDSEKYGNCANIDLFVNIQWKRACIFIKAVNINMGWPNKSVDYFSAHHYIGSQRAVKFGIFWPFYIQPGKNASVGAGGGGGEGGRGGDRNNSMGLGGMDMGAGGMGGFGGLSPSRR